MKISNRRAKNQFTFIYVMLLSIFILNVFDDNVSGKLGGSLSNSYLLLLFLLTSFLLFWRGLPLFKYDSDGEVLIVKASEPVLISKISDSKFFAEFPKTKLRGFSIRENFFRKTLYLQLRGTDKRKTLKIPISYLNKKELVLLETSLKNVLKNNKKELVDEPRPVRGRIAI